LASGVESGETHGAKTDNNPRANNIQRLKRDATDNRPMMFHNRIFKNIFYISLTRWVGSEGLGSAQLGP
jgi:hypothetical protein